MGSLCSREVNFQELEDHRVHRGHDEDNHTPTVVTVPLWDHGGHLSDEARDT